MRHNVIEAIGHFIEYYLTSIFRGGHSGSKL